MYMTASEIMKGFFTLHCFSLRILYIKFLLIEQFLWYSVTYIPCMFICICISTVKWDDLQKAGKIDIFETASNFFFLQSFQ